MSPDETQLAVEVLDGARGLEDIWVWDLARNLGSRFTFENGDALDPVWLPDGAGLVFSKATSTGWDLYLKRFGGGSVDSVLLASAEQKVGCNWSPDGRTLLYYSRGASSARRWDVFALTLGERPRPLVATEFIEYGPRISPDGQLFAYTSWESGKEEVYVQSFGAGGGKWRISTEGGREPQWRGDGRELFYVTRGRQLFGVSVEPGPKFSLPTRLFDAAAMIPEVNLRNRYVVTRDGQKFLIVTQQGVTKLGATTVVLDWLAAHGQH